MSEEVARAIGDLIAENAALHVEITVLKRLIGDLQLRNQAVMGDRDQIAQAALDLVGDLTLLPSRLWQFNGEALERDYQALKTLLDQAAVKAR